MTLLMEARRIAPQEGNLFSVLINSTSTVSRFVFEEADSFCLRKERRITVFFFCFFCLQLCLDELETSSSCRNMRSGLQSPARVFVFFCVDNIMRVPIRRLSALCNRRRPPETSLPFVRRVCGFGGGAEKFSSCCDRPFSFDPVTFQERHVLDSCDMLLVG